jgi:hypothetical protein
MEQNLDMHATLSALVAFGAGQQSITSTQAMVCCAQSISRKAYVALASPASALVEFCDADVLLEITARPLYDAVA